MEWFDIDVTPAGKRGDAVSYYGSEEEPATAAEVGAVVWSGNNLAMTLEAPARIPAGDEAFAVKLRVKNTTKQPMEYVDIRLGGHTSSTTRWRAWPSTATTTTTSSRSRGRWRWGRVDRARRRARVRVPGDAARGRQRRQARAARAGRRDRGARRAQAQVPVPGGDGDGGDRAGACNACERGARTAGKHAVGAPEGADSSDEAAEASAVAGAGPAAATGAGPVIGASAGVAAAVAGVVAGK